MGGKNPELNEGDHMRRKKKAMKPYAEMTKEELQELRKQLSTKYREYQGKDLRLDMSIGKPRENQQN